MSDIPALDCGHFEILYGRDYTTDETHCYACCAKMERVSMRETGKAALYLIKVETQSGFQLTNFGGKLVFVVPFITHGKHNIARTRIDIWFRGPDGFIWWGVSYGKNTQLCHCKRTKQKEW